MLVREFSKSDEEPFLEMCKDFYEAEATLRSYDEVIARKTFKRVIDRHENLWGYMLIDKSDDDFLGYALLTSYWSNEEGGEVIVLDELFVCPLGRSKGYGKRFMLWMEENFTDAVAITLEVLTSNHRAQELYYKAGYMPDGFTTYTKSLKKMTAL